MPDTIGDALAWLYGQLKTTAMKGVTYWRASANNGGNGDVSLPVQTMLGRAFFTMASSATGPPPDPKKAPRDFWVLADDLALSGPLLPKDGDWIIESIEGVDHRYNVSAPQKGGAVYEQHTGYRSPAMLIVHTKYQGVEVATEASSLLLTHTADTYIVEQYTLSHTADTYLA